MSQPNKKVKISAGQLLEKVLQSTDDEKTKVNILNAFTGIEKDEQLVFAQEKTEQFKDACITLKKYVEGNDDMDPNKLKELCEIFHGFVSFSKQDFDLSFRTSMHKLAHNSYSYCMLLPYLLGSEAVAVENYWSFSREVEIRLGKEASDFFYDTKMRMIVIYMGFYKNEKVLLTLAHDFLFELRDLKATELMQVRKLITDVWRYYQTLEKKEKE